jgi:hypothetical protein
MMAETIQQVADVLSKRRVRRRAVAFESRTSDCPQSDFEFVQLIRLVSFEDSRGVLAEAPRMLNRQIGLFAREIVTLGDEAAATCSSANTKFFRAHSKAGLE